MSIITIEGFIMELFIKDFMVKENFKTIRAYSKHKLIVMLEFTTTMKPNVVISDVIIVVMLIAVIIMKIVILVIKFY